MTATAPPDGLHTTAQAAAALDIPARLIYQWRAAGRAQEQGAIRAPVPGGLQPLWDLAELEPLATAYKSKRRTARAVDPTPTRE